MHCPEHAAEAAEARRLGGLRRRREVAVSGAYDFCGLESVGDIRRLLEVGELEQRLASLESVLRGPRVLPEPVFDEQPESISVSL